MKHLLKYTWVVIAFVLLSTSVNASNLYGDTLVFSGEVRTKDCLKQFEDGKELFRESFPDSQSKLQRIFFVTDEGKVIGIEITIQEERNISCNSYKLDK